MNDMSLGRDYLLSWPIKDKRNYNTSVDGAILSINYLLISMPIINILAVY